MDRANVIENLKREITNNGKDPEYDGVFDISSLKDFKVEEVAQKGGEDEGSEYYRVYKLSKDSDLMYVKISGYYNSYEGVDWSYGDVIEVEPYEKTVTDWRKVK